MGVMHFNNAPGQTIFLEEFFGVFIFLGPPLVSILPGPEDVIIILILVLSLDSVSSHSLCYSCW